MRRSNSRRLLVFVFILVLICAFVFVQARISIANSRGRATAEALGTLAVTAVCATQLAQGESPPLCNPE